MEHEKNKEYEYGGLTINGFAMIFFTFIHTCPNNA